MFNSKEAAIIRSLADRFNYLKSKIKVTPKYGCDPKKSFYEDDLPRFYGQALSIAIATTPDSLEIVEDRYGNKERLVNLDQVYSKFKKEVQDPIDLGYKICYTNKYTGEEKEIPLKIPTKANLLLFLKEDPRFKVEGRELYYNGYYDLVTWGIMFIDGLQSNSEFMKILKKNDKKHVLDDPYNRTLYDKQICQTLREKIQDKYEQEIIYSYFTTLSMYEEILKELYKRIGKKGRKSEMEDRLKQAKESSE